MMAWRKNEPEIAGRTSKTFRQLSISILGWLCISTKIAKDLENKAPKKEADQESDDKGLDIHVIISSGLCTLKHRMTDCSLDV